MSWRLQAEQVELLVVDAQEKMMDAVSDREWVEKKLTQLVQGCVLLGIPVTFTEQYPKGLGKTLPGIRKAAPDAPVYEKTAFSAGEFTDKLQRKKILVAGLEAHICVRQTVYDLQMKGKSVVLVADAVGSRFFINRDIALAEIQTDAVLTTSVEAVLFELMADSNHPKFKEISALIK